MKQSRPNAHAMRYTNRLAWEEKYIDSNLGEGKLWFQTGADGARLASSGKSI